MVGHQKFQDGAADALDVLSAGLHLHAWLNHSNAGGGVNALPNIDHAQAADTHGFLILLVTQSRDGDATLLSRFEDRCHFPACAVDNKRLAIDRELDLLARNECC